MKIKRVVPNNHKKAFVVHTRDGPLSIPYAVLKPSPSSKTPLDSVGEIADDGLSFSYTLISGETGVVTVSTLDRYHATSSEFNQRMLRRLTQEVLDALSTKPISKSELARQLSTSMSQLYRLLDPDYDKKSVGQMCALLHLLGKEVDFVIRDIGESRE